MDRILFIRMDDKKADDLALLLGAWIGLVGILGHNYLVRGYVLMPGY